MDLFSRPCPLCGSTDYSKILIESNFDSSKMNKYSFASRKRPEFMHFRMVICPDCELCYASPTPHLSWFQREYIDADFDAANESCYAAKTYARCLSRNVDSLTALDGALDIGTGDGAFLVELLKHGLTKVQGVEPSKAPIQCANKAVASLIHHSFFKPEMFASESFNLISCFQTLEHLDNPQKLFKAVHGLLRPGGCFFIVAHNYTSFSAKVLRGKSPIFDIEHLQLLSPASASTLYKNSGFTDVRIIHLFNRYPLSYWLRLAPFGEKFKKRVDNLCKTFGISTLSVGLPAGNIAAIGYKPTIST